MKEKLYGKTLTELGVIAESLGLPSFAAGQIARRLYKNHARTIEEMTELSKAARIDLAEKYEIGLEPPVRETTSTDGTKKYLYRVIPRGPSNGMDTKRYVESAYIPENDRATLCVSTQVGCKMGCLFCMTGKQGFQGQLTAGEVLNQFESLPEREKVTNLVYMGMGEPFDNLEAVLASLEILTSDWGYAMSASRITVPTIGIIPGMKSFLERSSAHLAVSLHSPFYEERRRLMPIQHVYPLREVIEEIRSFDLPKQRRVSFEYIVFGGLNHSPAHVKELSRLLQGMRCRINLIRFHPIPETPLGPATEGEMMDFQERLNAKGLRTTIRRSRGQDILAACGLLSTKEFVRKKDEDY
jgi:23S rRNA (adenine2503-C2)-methyltransferase